MLQPRLLALSEFNLCIKLQNKLHPPSTWHELCLRSKHARDNFDSVELLVDHLSMYLEHSAPEHPSNATETEELFAEGMVGYPRLSNKD